MSRVIATTFPRPPLTMIVTDAEELQDVIAPYRRMFMASHDDPPARFWLEGINCGKWCAKHWTGLQQA
jgi:hypothetical protein